MNVHNLKSQFVACIIVLVSCLSRATFALDTFSIIHLPLRVLPASALSQVLCLVMLPQLFGQPATPLSQPSSSPTPTPTAAVVPPQDVPSEAPSSQLSPESPSSNSTESPPTSDPIESPSSQPTKLSKTGPTNAPTAVPSADLDSSTSPSLLPTLAPTAVPSTNSDSSTSPSLLPTLAPTIAPSIPRGPEIPTENPTEDLRGNPTESTRVKPSEKPTENSSSQPTSRPSTKILSAIVGKDESTKKLNPGEIAAVVIGVTGFLGFVGGLAYSFAGRRAYNPLKRPLNTQYAGF